MPKRAIVLGGGGTRGSYELGVWEALRELGIDYDIVTGTSIGALNAVMMAQDALEADRELWAGLSWPEVFDGEPNETILTLNNRLDLFAGAVSRKRPFAETSVHPLERLIARSVDEPLVRRSPVRMGLVTAEYPTLTPHELTIDEIPKGRLVDFLLASCACYPVMPMRLIEERRYIDGGFVNDVPISLALRMGAEEIIACDLAAFGMVLPSFASVPVQSIHPSRPLGPVFGFEQAVLQRNRRIGYQDTLRALAGYGGERYLFWPLDTQEFYRDFRELWPEFSSLLAFGRAEEDDDEQSTLSLLDPSAAADRALMAGLEETAELYGVDDLAIYDPRALTRHLCAAESAESERLAERIRALTAPTLDPGELLGRLRALRGIDTGVAVSALLALLRSDEGKPPLLGQLGLLFPGALRMAAFLWLGERAYRR